MTGAPTASGTTLHAQSQGPNQKRKPPSKTKYTRFDTLVGRYYPAVYSFASRLSDDPREAISLTHDAFNTIRTRRWHRRNEVMLATMLLNAVIVAGLKGSLSRTERRNVSLPKLAARCIKVPELQSKYCSASMRCAVVSLSLRSRLRRKHSRFCDRPFR
jgi:hypothetical protein